MANKRVSQLAAAGSLGGADLLLVSRLSGTLVLEAQTISAIEGVGFADAASGFLAAGFAPGMQVHVAGFSNVGNNVYSATVGAVVAGMLTLAGPEPATIIDESAGAFITISAWESVRVTAAELAGFAAGSAVVQCIPVAVGDELSPVSAGPSKVAFHMPFAFNLMEVRAGLRTAQAGGSVLTVDINADGTSVLSTPITVDNTEKLSTSAATPPVIGTSAIADGAEIAVDVDQIGDGSATGLKVYLIGTLA